MKSSKLKEFTTERTHRKGFATMKLRFRLHLMVTTLHKKLT